MSAATVLPLITVEQFEAIPDPKGDFTYELHFGRLVRVSKPKMGHGLLQEFIRELLRTALDPKRWLVMVEMAYTLADGFDARAADVGVVSQARVKQTGTADYLTGAPELVVFVKSGSNRDTQIEKDAIECLTHGSLCAWYVKTQPERTVIVYTAAERKEYRPGQSIRLPESMGGRIKVSDIFKRLPK